MVLVLLLSAGVVTVRALQAVSLSLDPSEPFVADVQSSVPQAVTWRKSIGLQKEEGLI